MIYFEYHFTDDKRNKGYFKKCDLNCEYHETNSEGFWGYIKPPFKLNNHTNLWIEQTWIDIKKTNIKNIKNSYLNYQMKSIVINEIRKQKLNRICKSY